jgi:hypothetical protein
MTCRAFPGKTKHHTTSVQADAEQFDWLHKKGFNNQDAFSAGVEALLEKGPRTGPLRKRRKGGSARPHVSVTYDYDKLEQLKNYGYTFTEAFQEGISLIQASGKTKQEINSEKARDYIAQKVNRAGL